MPRFLPLALDMRDKRCVIVGGGAVGTRKAHTLVRSGADVTVISPSLTPSLAELAEAGQIRWQEGTYRDEYVRTAFLVIAATSDETLNATIVRLATQNGALACDASSADRSGVIFGALLEEDDATIAVFTDGRAPAHARRTRDQIAHLLRRPRE